MWWLFLLVESLPYQLHIRSCEREHSPNTIFLFKLLVFHEWQICYSSTHYCSSGLSLQPLFFFPWLHCMACGILVSQPRMQSGLATVKAWSPNHWATREFPSSPPPNQSLILKWNQWHDHMTLLLKNMGREEGGGFGMGNTCIPVGDSFWYLAKLIQLCKV